MKLIYLKSLKKPLRTLRGVYGKLGGIKKNSKSRRFLPLAFGLSLALIPLVIYQLFNANRSEAVWFNDGWHYRQKITFGNTGAADSNKKVKFDIDTAALTTDKLQANCADARFTDVNGNPLRFYLDSAGGACDTASTDYYVLMPTISAGTNVVYFYYGNTSAYNAGEIAQFSESTFSPTSGPTFAGEEKGSPPVAWWKFDEGVDNSCSGGTNDTCDNTSNNLDGAISGAAWQAEEMCVSGKCLGFDGSDDVVTVTNAPAIDFDTGLADGVTFSTWVRVNSDGESNVGEIFDKGTNTYCRTDTEASGAVDLECRLDLATTDASLNVTGALTLNRWHHVAMTYSDDGDDEITIYVDGVNKGSSSDGVGSPASGDTNNLLIGGDTAANFHGFIDEFKVYGYERSAAEIKNDFVLGSSNHGASATFGYDNQKFLSDGLVGYWKLDESSSSASDSSGNGYTLTNNGTTTYVTGRFGNGSEHVPASSQYFTANSLTSTNASVTTSTVTTPTGNSFQRKTWYDGTRYWQALNANSRIEFWYSTDGSSWTENTAARLAYNYYDFSLYTDSTRAYIAYTSNHNDIEVRAATSYPGTTFAWGSATIVYNYSQATWTKLGTLTRDSAGYLWLTADVNDLGVDSLYIKRSTNTDDTTAWNTSTILEAFLSNSIPNTVIPRASGSVYVVWKNHDVGKIYGKNYNGSSWDVSETEIATTTGTELSAVSDNYGNVHLIYTNTNGNLSYTEFTSSWQNAVTLDSNAGNSSPTISTDTANSNAVFAHWIRGNAIYYKKGVADYTTTNWSSTATSFYSTGTNTSLTSNFSDNSSGKNAFLGWTNGSGSPYSVYWGYHDGDTQTINSIQSLSFWVNPDTTTNYYLSLTAGVYITSTSGTLAATGFTNPKIYVNGVETTAIAADSWQLVTVTSETAINADSFYIGRQDTNYYDGTMDEVRLYNRALSPAEIADLYNWAPGPVGYWPMDEGTGTSTTHDKSGNGVNGTLTSITENSWVPGKFGSGLQLDGSADFVDIGTGPTLVNTVEFWVKPATTTEYFVNLTGTSDYIWANAGTVTATGFSSPTIYINGVPSTTLTAGVWQHVSVTTATAENASNLEIGRTADANYLEGIIDDVRLYNYVRTPEQIISDMNAGHPVPGSPIGSAVARWRFDEGYGTTAYDNSINGNDLTLSAERWSASGKFGSAWSGVGSNWASRADDGDLDFAATESFSIVGWFKRSSTVAAEVLLQKFESVGADGGYRIQMESDGDISFAIDDDNTAFGDTVSSTTANYDDGLWHQFIAVKNSNTSIQLYLDGILVGTTSVTETGTLENNDAFYVGDSNGVDDGDEFSGDIDELIVYRFALSADQVKIAYNQVSANVLGSTSTDSSGKATWSQNEAYCPPGTATSCTGPVGDWPMDENTGTTVVNDISSTVNPLSMTSMTENSWVAGVRGSALTFDGVADRLSMTDDAAFDFAAADSFTIMGWFKHDTASDIDTILAKYETTGADGGYLIQMEADGDITCAIDDDNSGSPYDDQVTSTAATYDDNEWHFFVCVKNATTSLTLYLDGVQVAQDTSIAAVGTLANNDNLRIGINGDGANFWDGELDELKVFREAASVAKIAWLFNGGLPVGHWRLDECQGSVAYDSGSGGNNGTINIGGTGTYTTPGSCNSGVSTEAWNAGTVGKRNASLGFDGTNDYVDMGDRYDPYISDLSVFAWIQTNYSVVALDVPMIVSKRDSAITTNPGYQLFMNDGATLSFTFGDGSGSRVRVNSTGPTLNDGNWHYVGVVFTRSGNGILYVDGKPASGGSGSISAHSASIDNAINLRVGQEEQSGSPFYWNWKGLIDEVKIWNYALNATQVKIEYNDGAVRFD